LARNAKSKRRLCELAIYYSGCQSEIEISVSGNIALVDYRRLSDSKIYFETAEEGEGVAACVLADRQKTHKNIRNRPTFCWSVELNVVFILL
jgi:hypothetical protein